MFVLYRHVCLYTWRTYPGQPHITLGGNQHIGWVSCSTILRVSGCSGHAPRCRLACLRRFLFVCSSAAARAAARDYVNAERDRCCVIMFCTILRGDGSFRRSPRVESRVEMYGSTIAAVLQQKQHVQHPTQRPTLYSSST